MSDHIGRETGRHYTALFRGDHTLVLLLEEDRYSSKKESFKKMQYCLLELSHLQIYLPFDR